jgi:Na+/H+ antiporter NhaD/arsenite permease-like protein
MPPIEFLLFGATLLGVALLHRHVLAVALTGLAAITVYKLLATGFHGTPGLPGLLAHLAHEWVILANLFGLLVGFALLADHFELSKVPKVLPSYLPNDWHGGLALLGIVFVLSAFLDNIAAALIGATMAAGVFRNRVHIGYLAAVVAASNAGGSGSVLGDTTTTMMWIDGVAAIDVLHAYAAAIPAFFVFAIPASLQQHGYSPIVKEGIDMHRIDWVRIVIVALMLLAAIMANVTVNRLPAAVGESLPFLGIAVWLVLLLTSKWRKPTWNILPSAVTGSVFLLALVLCASLMPVEKLPSASPATALGLGFLSAVFDNIPLTKLALDAGGYDWGYLAFAVGFGGSMIWFGSSAGVAVSNRFPEAKSVVAWIRGGWHVALAYVIGFGVMHFVLGWQPHVPHR